MQSSLSQSSLLEYAAQRTGCKVIARLSGDGNPTRFFGVLELAVTTSSCYKKPPVVGEQF